MGMTTRDSTIQACCSIRHGELEAVNPAPMEERLALEGDSVEFAGARPMLAVVAPAVLV